MDMKIKTPELKCMDPENYRKYFRALCWSGTRRTDKKPPKKFNKKDRLKRLKGSNALAICYTPALLANPSQFTVYATVRRTVLARCRQLQAAAADCSDDSDDDGALSISITKVPKVTGIGLRTVFSLISQARFTDPNLCEQSLRALLDVLQGHAPEDLAHEQHEIMLNLHTMLIEVSTTGVGGRIETPSTLTALSSSCLIALAVARGEAELVLSAVTSLVMASPSLTEQYIHIPTNLTILQRSVHSAILGPPSRNLWLNFGVPHKSLVTSFPVDLPPQLTGTGELVVRSLVSDGCYLYVFTSKGLLKIGSGYGSSIRQHVYQYKPDFFASDRHGWLGYCKNKLYVRIGRKKNEVFEVDKETLEVRSVLRLEAGQPAPVEPKSAVFTDGHQLGLVLLTNYDNLTIRMFDVETNASERLHGGTHALSARRELNVHLLRRRTLVLGRPSFDDGLSRRMVDLDAPVAMQLDDNEDDPLLGICSGQDFGLLTTSSGKVYYTGKGTSLGYKVPVPHTGRWTLMKETLFNKHEVASIRKCKVVQVALGHEGVHAILVLDNGTALFTGVARRGEDGDANRHRRTPKPTRPKKILRAEGHHIVYAACNYGSTALVTRHGQLLMFGKDTQHCDENGLVTGLRHERVIQVALGKAHAVALTNFGQVYTFGINNKGQCGREFGYTKEKPFLREGGDKEELRICQSDHSWSMEYCRVCVLCRECTGFGSACHCALLPIRQPGEKCGCGEGDSGCSVCGICKQCAEASTSNASTSVSDPPFFPSDKEATQSDGAVPVCGDEREAGVKVTSLPPARVAVPGGHRIVAVACGLHHTVLLTEHGDVLTFGSNQWGALGAGDIASHHRLVRVRVPRASAVAAGSNHTGVLTRDGELYTFGSYQKGSLGRPRQEEPRSDRSPVWYATPERVPRIGPRHGCRAVWLCASGDQTFVQVSQALINTDTLFSSTITANNNSIVILPNRPEHTFKCITINKTDGSCNAWTGPEQVDFVNTLACLDPLYDVLWCYQPQMRVMKCFNIIAFDSHKLQRCCSNDPEAFSDVEFDYPNYGCLKRLEDFRHMESFEWITNNVEDQEAENVVLSNMSVLNQELAIPCTVGCQVTRIHAALHLLGCLDSLTYAHDNRSPVVECKRDINIQPIIPVVEDYQTVSRFENHGGGWGYSGHSVEAIRFMCDCDILLGGVGLYGGRGEYTAKIRLYDIGPDGGDQEGDGEVIFESDEVFYECPSKDRFPLMFDSPVPLIAGRWYVAAATINGPSSDCGSAGQAMVINDDVGFHFKTSKKSNNGTDVNAGQLPCLLYNVLGPDHPMPIRHLDPGEPVIVLSKNISRKVTVPCFRSLITLMQWSWRTFKDILLETNGQVPINYQKLTLMKHQKRLVYIIRAGLRLVRSYIKEVYPQSVKRRNSPDYMSYFESIAEIRNFIQSMMADPTPSCSMLPRRPGRSKAHRICYVQFALDLTNSILMEAHETFTVCFYAFFPTPILKWNHLCFMLCHVKDGSVNWTHIRELTATCSAMCLSQSLRDVLQYIVPLTHSQNGTTDTRRIDNKMIKDVPCKSATVPRSSHAQKPPPIPPRAKDRVNDNEKSNYLDWHLLDVVPRLLDVVLNPIKQQLTRRQCAPPHDHGELSTQERLSECCCKLTSRVIAEMSFSALQAKDDPESKSNKHLVTASRFMRVNSARSWSTGNGSPDAICFTVDRPGVALVGACVFVGSGLYDYTIELLHDMRTSSEESNATHCWVSLEAADGSFSSGDAHHEMVNIKFNKPVLLKDEIRYALRLCCEGARTASGDCGLPAVTGPDGTTFQFSSCSLSFNGTSIARGQLPCLIYYRTKWVERSVESSSSASTSNARVNMSRFSEESECDRGAVRDAAVSVASLVAERASLLLASTRALPPDELRRAAPALATAPALNTLLPYALANLEGLNDSKSVIQLLEMVHKLLPHVAAVNLLIPSVEEVSSSTTSQFYTWVESDHPYRQATVVNKRVLFPPQVAWIVLEMDPRSITAQPEDTLTIYAVAGAPRHRCHCSGDTRVIDPPFRKVYKRLIQLTSETGEVEELEEASSDAPCMHYNCTYVSVTPRLGNMQADWPQKALLVPGNEVIFSLETASDYLNEYNQSENDDSRFGFRCLCIGYEDNWSGRSVLGSGFPSGLSTLEMELVHLGAACASRLLSPDLDIPPLTRATIVEVQTMALSSSTAGTSLMGDGACAAVDEDIADQSEALLISRGLELASPPAVHHVLDGLPLLRCISTERQFLSDFVSGVENTAGGRLARWLAPGPCVEPSRCELKQPLGPAVPSSRISMPIIIRDQYGDIVISPALKVEVVIQRVEDSASRSSHLVAERRTSIIDVPYQPTVRDTMSFHAITMMKPYQNYSFEEIRYASGAWGGTSGALEAIGSGGRVPAERIVVEAQKDGSYTAVWVPRVSGTYIFRCTLDDHPASQDLKVEVLESASEVLSEERWAGCSAPYRLRRYTAKGSSGLRVRASPSLQAEELGRVPPGAHVAFVEELINKDGTWVRLSGESAATYAEGGGGVGWCMQYNRALDRTLLQPAEDDESQEEYMASWSGFKENQQDQAQWQDDDADAASNDLSSEDRRFPFSIQCDLNTESDSSTSQHIFGEPSKRDRLARIESSSAPSPRRTPRRNNGNSDEWCSPIKFRSSDNVHDLVDLKESAILGGRDDIKMGRLAQTGTQTSPENSLDEAGNSHYDSNADESESPRRVLSRERCRSSRSSSPPPLPARTHHPRKNALSPAQAECLRAVFAALLWHEGTVHDAIACAAFLKFHPQLPKGGARVVTRPQPEAAPARPQRHSVEVTNAGQYLHIHPSTLETLTRSGTEASTSRARKSDIDVAIREEDAGFVTHIHEVSTPAVVNVLPPALRALVALWDALNEAEQLNVATDKFKKELSERNENEETRMGVLRKKKELKSGRAPLTVPCELCGGTNVPPPLAAHMRHMHPGCRAITSKGYDRAGAYKLADPLPTNKDSTTSECGQIAQDLIGVKIRATLSAYQLWYIYCEKCRERALKTAQQKTAEPEEGCTSRVKPRLVPPPDLDHLAIRDNAVFLLDLAPLTNSESGSACRWGEIGGRSPPTPPGSVWQPAPPFQCLMALGVEPKTTTQIPDSARYHSLGRPMQAASINDGASTSNDPMVPQCVRVPRSVSMGQAGGRDLAHAARPPLANFEPDTQDTLTVGAGSSLLAQPSAALQKLVGGGEWASDICAVSAFEPPQVDPEVLMQSPVLAFILAKRDLPAYRQKMDALVRINTVRQYAFESMNWLLRSTTQPTSVHDVMWWFCNALDNFACIVPSPLSFEDNKENSVNFTPTASAAAICPGGRSARGARAAFHAFLGSVSALAPSLHPASAAALQAVRCWALHYSHHDRAFLHRSQVFSVISKILSHSEDGGHEDGMFGALQESYHSYTNKNYVWGCPDVTGWCEVTVSSRPAMAGSLTDGSTETFWESGDEDRNRAKWIQLAFSGPSHQDRPHVFCVHVDNTRDTVNKTLLMSFLYSSGSSEMAHMQDIEVDVKSASWICYTLPTCMLSGTSTSSVRVRCELRGPEPSVRVRQLRVLGAPLALLEPQTPHPLHSLAERDTLRVFRLLTSHVFGKLLEWEQTSSDSNEGAIAEGAVGDDSDLREHVVGILFAGHKLTSLQRQVMSHIVTAIGCEAARVRDDWETALLCSEAVVEGSPRPPHIQDNYCFEMLSLLLALSGSAVGRVHLAQRTELLVDLLALLHTGSERVQRQVISLLRRMIAEVPPHKMLSALNYGGDLSTQVTLLDHLVCYLGKAITVQVKVKGAGTMSPGTVTLGGSVTPSPPALWFMRGETTKKHAHLVARLLSDMAEDKVSDSWGMETRGALARYVCVVAQMEETDRRPPRCISLPTVWLALAALCVCDDNHIEQMNVSGDGRESRNRDSITEARSHCANHDDGSTLAVIECQSCGPLCAECDRFLHLNRAARNHQRQICKEEESTIRIDIHEGCGRAKMFWLLLLVDRRTLKALVEFRGIEGSGEDGAVAGGSASGSGPTDGAFMLAGICRFCGARGNSGLLAIGNVCADQQCQEHGREACSRVLVCGHACGGVRGERSCLPCLFGCAGAEALRQDADDMCMICFTDPLQAAPAVQLSCGHIFHLHCCKKVLANKWVGPRITFSFSQCPICKEDMNHWTLEEVLVPIRNLRDEVKRKALMRLEYEGLAAGGSHSRAQSDPATYAMDRYAYYVCHKCGKAYFGGLARCEAESNGWWEPAELVCGACSDVAGARTCPKHGADFLEYKCRYCCSVAVFFCFGTSHFCNACHDDFQRVTNIPRHLLPQCPAGPKGEQLPGSSEECPLHVQHPPTGEEFALGCGVCRHAHAF
ncbi:E3 ubiquitin-protein ligase MYCBP2 isoform X5 [Danaus plexippus]|uniref:E3 ubiquitin-protein ligase MYCBP2 isoform X5 n=1 Tax=Danaus plexippus TaxID=13037 RepID=UPI002AB074FB|nr:E3 ubiquitin-protein ligase MYCBP2 isoform X5 [Danaus plexippus]